MDKYNKIVKMWQGYNIKSAADIDKYLDSFRVLFAYNSGKIENPDITYHSTREIFENGKISGYTGSVKALFEQQNQKQCYDFLKEKIAAHTPITADLIKEIHFILTSGTYDERRYAGGERPGSFKLHDYAVGINEVGAIPDDVENEIGELLAELERNADKKPLKTGTYLHARFEYIHPFADGNGRVGRTLLNYHFMINNHPPIIIFDDDKQEYYKALEKYDTDEDFMPLHNFLKYETEKTWTKKLEHELKTPASEIELDEITAASASEAKKTDAQTDEQSQSVISDEDSEKFIQRVNEIAEWSKKVIAKAEERKQELQEKNKSGDER